MGSLKIIGLDVSHRKKGMRKDGNRADNCSIRLREGKERRVTEVKGEEGETGKDGTIGRN